MQKYKVLDFLGLLLSVASLVTVFMIVPPLYLAPLGLLFSITSKIKSTGPNFAKISIVLSVVSLLIVAALYWFMSGIQIGP
jgi:hypothetical protein